MSIGNGINFYGPDGWQKAFLGIQPQQFWEGEPGNSTSVRFGEYARNLFTNPNNESDGEVVVWENRFRNPDMQGHAYGNSMDRSPLDAEGWTVLETTGGPTPYFGTSSASQGYGAAVDDVSGEIEFSFSMKPVDAPVRLDVRVSEYDSEGVPTTVTLIPRTAYAEEQRLVARWVPDSGTAWVRPIVYVYDEANGTSAGVKVAVKDFMVAMAGTPYLDETFSPDPDLTPESRPGGGSQLVGQKVRGLGVTRGVAIQSTQWPGRATTIRLLNNTGSNAPYVSSGTTFSDPTAVIVDQYQNSASSTNGPNDRKVGFNPPLSLGEQPPNEPGVRTLVKENTEGGPRPIMYGSSTLGDSVWFDLLTVTDTEGYTGPPFSGDTP